eukprot:8316229-Pyramimonas_sp.AAC.1
MSHLKDMMKALLARCGAQPIYDFYHDWKSDEEELLTTMISELINELKDLEIGAQAVQEYLLDLYTGDVHKAGDDSMMLTDGDLRRHLHLVDEADLREMEAFCSHKVFVPRLRKDLPSGANIVDCVWVRKWAITHKKVKSRVLRQMMF